MIKIIVRGKRMKLFYVIAILSIVLVACQQAQQGVPKDISVVPIDQIPVEDNAPAMEDTAEDAAMPVEAPVSDIEITPDAPDMQADVAEEAAEDVEEATAEQAGQNSEIVIIVQENDLVNIRPVAKDPDADTLSYDYSAPLNQEGQWQTTYGDAGSYTLTITVSDGELSASKDALLIVNKKEEPPMIDSFDPKDTDSSIKETDSISFKVSASDLNKDPLSFVWKLDGNEVSTGSTFNFQTDYSSQGSHAIRVDVSDGTSTVSQLWAVDVANVNRPPALKVLPDITVKENEVVVISPDASDPDDDQLSYTISSPVGDSGVWQTGYDSAGVYNVKVTASDGTSEDSQDVRITVINVNRPPVIDDIIQVK